MADRIQIQIGALPWAPSSDAKIVQIYDYYDMPLAGLINQHDLVYAFWCLEGQTEDFSLWAYMLLSPEQVAYLESAQNIDEALEKLMSTGWPLTIAVSREGLGVISFATFDDSRLAELAHQAVSDETLARSWLTEVNRQVREGSEPSLEEAIYKSVYSTGPSTATVSLADSLVSSPLIFIAHSQGDSERARVVARSIEQLVTGADVVVFDDSSVAGRSISEMLEARLGAASYALVLVPPTRVDSTTDTTSRLNVSFELGYLLGRLGQHRVAAIVEKGDALPSDTAGLLRLSLDPKGRWRRALAVALREAGLRVDAEGASTR